ncbi:E3 ubiquitin-protein ligase TRIM39-like [Chanos chanos]|uniref:E3 ubiquitin-protein ligase TRIM39-like n=1 Tax=Chanos chanos TaxID=29144 RepID=A0A6J2VTQ1_CHACN|nr:E3 ubiquitin-protein ligase TRIM39-like [Chanos chanos]
MSSFSDPSSEEELQCLVCQNDFTDSVAVPCGHKFCKNCITHYWNTNDCLECPTCKQTFQSIPEFQIDTESEEKDETVEEFNETEVLCDFCSDKKVKAFKSCLHCGMSYCETHLEPHENVEKLKKHKLMEPVENLTDYICQKHERPLELFCRDDRSYVCYFCTEGEHKYHNAIPVEEENAAWKAKLGKLQAEVKQMIQDRLKRTEEIKRLVELSEKNVEMETADLLEICAALIRSVRKIQAELSKAMEEKQKATEERAEGLIQELQEEISELQRRDSELEQLSHTENHFHLLQLLQVSPSLCSLPQTKEWPDIRINTELSMRTLRKALSQLETVLDEKLSETELKKIQHYAVEVSLDADTAYPKLIVSDDGKEVAYGNTRQCLPDNPERFDTCVCVLGTQGFSSGRFYYEVEVKEKTDWDIGVVKESVNRKGKISVITKNGYWRVWLRNGNRYVAVTNFNIPLSLRQEPRKVGVFVDYEEGLVSFYDVEAKSHIYSFTDQSFTEKLYPYFSPCPNYGGKNSAPLVITPVNHH